MKIGVDSMKNFLIIIQWLCVLWCIFCAFRITQHERDMYKAYYRMDKIRMQYQNDIDSINNINNKEE